MEDVHTTAHGCEPPKDGGGGDSAERRSLLGRFNAQVERSPDAIALIHGASRMTYRELQERSMTVALYLQHLNVGPGCIVGLCLERSPLLVSSILGILQAGAAYLPIDPRTPDARVTFMLDDCGVKWLLTESGLCEHLAGGERTVVRIDRDWDDIRRTVATLPLQPLGAGALAYVIYTSGSTGQPKGVLVPESNVLALFDASCARFRFGPHDTWALFHSYAFDFSVWEMWGALLYGGRLVIVPSDVSRNSEAFYELASRERVTVLNQTPSAFGQFIAVDEARRLPLQLRLVIFGGEALRFGKLRRWFERHGDARPELVNMYGITETTVHVTQRRVAAVESERVVASLIGRALPHLQIHILDESLRGVDDGVPGELCVSGAGLAWGYHNRASLTASRFIASPFVPGERLYRSGDLVRRNAEGEVEFLGRIDQQVKLRGFRIELGEIEASLLRHPRVGQAVAVERESGGERRLVAYVVPTVASRTDAAVRTDERVEQWQALYQDTYQPVQGECTPSFVGWHSSYTGAAIPDAEMREWLEATVNRILGRGPRRVLEIGCGVGLVLQRLAPRCETYVATDISSVAIARLGHWAQSTESLRHVRLSSQSAVDFAGLPEDFDTIVLNSVIQYFPSVQYLLDVLRQAAEHVVHGGKIFIGDVRHYGLLEAFHASVQFAKADDDLTVDGLRDAIGRGVRQEKELLVAPEFFRALPQWLPAIGAVEIQLKRGDADNELNRFRFDVWLHVGTPEHQAPPAMAWRADGDDPLRGLDGYLSSGRPAAVVLEDVPNARLEPDLKLLEEMKRSGGDLTWRELRHRTGRLPSSGVQPEALWRLGERHGYDVSVAWSEAAGHLTATFVDRQAAQASWEVFAQPLSATAAPQDYASDPLANSAQQAFVRDLREHMRRILPEHMLPSATVVLQALPLTVNGKVDKDRLPSPEERPDIADYAEPHTGLQRTLADIFADVLRLDRVGLHDNFFELGGHSLLAMRVVAQVRSQLSIELPLRAIFAHPTVAELEAGVAERLGQLQGAMSLPLMRHAARGAIPLSFAQERLWFLEQLGTLGAAYHVPLAFRVRGPLDVGALGGALADLVERHEILRTRFVVDGDEPRQIIDPPRPDILVIHDLSGLEESLAQAHVAELLQSEARHRTDFERGPLFRATLAGTGDDHVLILAAHHIAADGWSHTIMFRELNDLYDARVRKAASALPPAEFQYADYAVWQRRWLDEPLVSDQLRYWKQQLADAPEALVLPTDRPRPRVATFRGALHRFELPVAAAAQVARFARQRGATPFMVLLATFQVLLARWSGSEDIVVGSPTAGRTHRDTEQLVGLFINTLALRTRVDGPATFQGILAQVREMALAAYAHQDVPFEKVVAELRPHRDLSRQPIVQVVFALQNTPPAALQLGATRTERIECPSSTSKYDLTLNVIESGGRLHAEIEYATDLFDAATITRVATMYCALLEAAMESPGVAVSRLRLVSKPNSAQAEPIATHARRSSVCDLFEAQASRTPDAPAIESASSSVTYAQLNGRANQLGRYLSRRGVGRGDLVAVVSDHDIGTFVALLAVLKTGAAYLPIDANSPTDRLRHLLDDSRPRLILADSAMQHRLPGSGAEVIALQECERHSIDEIAGDLLDLHPGPMAEDAAYVIYTSGSTGKPKGVIVEHGGLRNLVLAQIEQFVIEPRSRLLQFASLSFDASASEIFTALCGGACLCLPGRAHALAGDELNMVLSERKITHVTLPPSVVPGIADAGGSSVLETLVTAGETCSAAVARCWPFPVRFINAYGPTEATVCATLHLCDADDPRDPPIGRPLVYAQVYVLDDALQRVPEGIAGEIYIGGPGVARGYLGQPSLTATRFLADPFTGAGTRMYRTGDRGRVRSDGVIEYLGRVDRQLKVRGFRIEPAEIETALLQDERVRQAFVTAQGELDERRLVAYAVVATQSPVSSEELRATMRGRLPAHMMPSVVVVMERFPLTVNGKIDQAALPIAEAEVARDAYIGPRTPAEQHLAAIWVDVLRCRPPDVRESFFALGGHSLLATRAVSRIRETMKVDLTLRDFFAASTLEQLARAVDAAKDQHLSMTAPKAVPRRPRMPMSYAQQSLWTLDKMGLASGAYNMPVTLRAHGKVDTAALERALSELVRRHESLRTCFMSDADGPYSVIQPPQDLRLDIRDLGPLDASVRGEESVRFQLAELQRQFDLRAGNLLHAVLLSLGTDEHLLSLTTHHIVADGWSIAILVNELRALYDAFAAGRESPLRNPELQCADYSVWQRERLDSELLERETRHWRDRLAGAPTVFELPADRSRPAVQSFRGALHRFRISKELHHSLLSLCAQHGVTLYMATLAAFNVLLARLSGVNDILIGSPVTVRTEPSLEGVVGLLLNTLVLRLDLADDPSFAELLARAKAATLEAYDHQELPFELVVGQMQPERDLARQPLVQVLFALQNYPSPDDGSSAFWEPVETPWSHAKYDLSLYLEETPEGLACQCEYATDLFEATTIERWCDHLLCLLTGAIADPAERISRLPLLSEPLRRRLIVEWNDTAHAGLDSLSIPDLVHLQAQRQPDAVAVTSVDRVLTYAELDQRSTALASWLQRAGAVCGERVGICLDRSVDLSVALLAALKSGAVYVPLDPAYPQQRIDYMAADSGVSYVLTDRQSSARASALIGRMPALVADETGFPVSGAGEAAGFRRPADGIAYIIYTSGSTGRPKGCVVTDRALLNLLGALADQFRVGADDRLLAVTPYSFDIAGLELLMPLIRGAQTHICPSAHTRDAQRLLQTIRDVRPTIMQATPATWQMLCRAGWRNETDAQILCGGEALPDSLRQQLPQGGAVWNLYGPTETTIWSTVERITAGTPTTIGKPIANTRLYVLDAAMMPTPIGVEGDLYIGGDGVARGYWNQPSLTAQRFVADPFSVGGIIYHTGDRARWRADGRLEYRGRSDSQVKIRGFRIELEEVEAALAAHPRVDVCACAIRADGEPQIVAAYVPTPDPKGAQLDRRDLQAHLRAILPEHMIPAEFFATQALPLTANGKIDRRGIAELRVAAVDRRQLADGGAIEQRLLDIWRSALGRQDINAEDGFFEQGGTSLLAVTVAQRIAEELQVDFETTSMFQFGSVSRIARHIESLAERLPTRPIAQPGRESPPVAGVPEYYADSVAVIGISCAFPDAGDLGAFWKNLLAGKESIERVPESELRELGVPERLLADPRYVPVRSALADREYFDASFFAVSERDAQLMDPQLRLLLMHSWRAIEDAGYRVDDVAETAVFATASTSAYHAKLLAGASGTGQSIEQYVGWIMAQNGTLPAVISQKLGLKGPSLFVHSNCSSSLSALDLARRRLLEGEWRFALVAAARVASFEGIGYVHQEGMNFSSDGHLRAFDAAADGAVGGEGVAVLLLKRAQEAIADGDPIYAVLRTTASNNDGGEAVGFYAPSVVGQRAVVDLALTSSGIDPESIGYVEAHGTGTPLGDPIEVAALSQAYGRSTDKRQFCGIGSVKTNIGHLDAAAGLAGCVKVALSLSRGEIPASLHFKSPNPALKLDRSPFYVVDSTRRWQGPRPYRAAVSSMGVGGSNVHAIFEECMAREAEDDGAFGPWLFPLSARDPECLRTLAEQLLAFVASGPSLSLRSLAYTLQVGRREMPYRVAVVAANAEELQARLHRYLEGEIAAVGVRTGLAPRSSGRERDPADVELESALARWASRDRYDKLSSLWVNGFAFDWRSLYASGTPRRINAPTYPFSKKRFWLDALVSPPSVQATPALRPALFAERWDQPALAGAEWAYLCHSVVCDFPSGSQSARAIMDQAAAAGRVIHVLPRTQASVGVRFAAYASALLDLVREAASAAPAMIQLVLPDDEEGIVCGALAQLLLSAKREYDKLEVQVVHLAMDSELEVARCIMGRSPFSARLVRCSDSSPKTRRFVPLHTQGGPGAVPWRDAGRYLITGGGGRLGMIIAREMAATLRAGTIVLVGRAEPTPDLAKQIAALCSEGLQVEYRRADVTDRSEVRALLAAVIERHGGVDGILHAAGVLDDGYVARKHAAQLQRVLAPKVAGLENLDQCHGSAPLDFFICFGSISGAAGSAGQCDYAAANAFMRAFAGLRNGRADRGLRQGRALCVDWPYWREGGMRLTDQGERELAGVGLVPLSTEDGLAALYRAWESGESSVTVLAGKTEDIGELLTAVDWRAAAETEAPSSVGSPDVTRLVLRRLIEVFSEVSKVDAAQIGGSDLLESFSIDSIMIAQLNQRLADAFPSLPKTLFYQFNTLAAIGDYLVAERSEACEQWVGAATDPATALPAAERVTPIAEPTHIGVRRSAGGSQEPIAIVGLAGRYPHARSLGQFWRNLRAGRDCIGPVPEQRWSLEGFFCDEPQLAIDRRMSYSKWGGFLEGFAEFDPLFFGISPAEALDMDPQERLFLQACWEALEDGNYTRQTLSSRHGGRVGVFAGITKTGFELHGRDIVGQGSPATPYTSFSSVANRVSYLLDLNGPSLPIDTMCSASLTAIHEACEHLLRDECEMALAGGVNLYLHPSTYVGLCSQRMLSTDGRCRSFGANATGFVPGEGVGVVLLKPLSRAERDRDRIHGVILASGINHGGRTHGYTVPNPRAQRDLVQKTLARAGTDPRDISYVEAHGTGTEMGDPIEVEALSQAFASRTLDRRFCALGSVKSNIGHLEAAAGIAGLTKVLLQFKHEELVPTLHSANVNPNIDMERTPFFLQHRIAHWDRPHRSDGSMALRTATVSSFGAGGANAFLVVQEYPHSVSASSGPLPRMLEPVVPIVVSARRADRLVEYARRLAIALEQDFSDADLPAIAATLQLGREAMEHRLAFAATSLAQVIDALRQYAQGGPPPRGTHIGKLDRNAAGAPPLEPADWRTPGQRDAMLSAWVRGATFDWRSLYLEVPAWASLPTYPFAEETYWPVAPQSGSGVAAPAAGLPAETLALAGGADPRPEAPAVSGATLLVPEWETVDGPGATPPDARLLVINATGPQLQSMDALAADKPITIDWSDRVSLRQIMAERAIARIVWFAPISAASTFESLLQEHAAAVEQGAALLQEIDESARRGVAIHLIAVTRCSQPVEIDDHTDPGHAAVVGFLRSAAKEYRGGTIVATDIGPGKEPPMAELASLRGVVGRATVYAYRYGRWCRSQLTTARTTDRRPSAFRRGGVYVIVGGAGHVGQQITEYLLREHEATIVWAGRRTASEVQVALSQFVGSRCPHYYQADATEVEPLRRMRDDVLARWGRIDAVLIATTHFSLSPLASLTSTRLREALHAKVVPAIRLAQTLGGDAIDGMVFFSSLVSFVGNRNQSHYAASCAWQDAFARFLFQHAGMRASVMNWGYWTIDDPQRSDELREIGIEFIDAASGGAALDALLSGPFTQLGFLRTRSSLAVEGMNLREGICIDSDQVRRVAYASLSLEGAAAANGGDASELKAFVQTAVTRELCRTLGMDPALLDHQAAFAEYGVDSISGLKVVRAINQALGISLAGPCLFEHPSLEKLIGHIVDAYRAAAMRAQANHGPAPTPYRPAAAEQPSQDRSVAILREPIAVIGMSGRFPQSDDSAELWRNLAAGRDLVEPATRWQDSGWQPDDDGTVCRHAGYIRDVECFDPLFFRISRADALHMDPQQRLCLEESWKALETAGHAGRAIAGKKCGVYVGCSGEDYTQLVDGELPISAMHGSSTALLSSRIAYYLDLHGPAMTVDTACSSGLVAVHLACQALWMDEIELAIAGGVHVQCTHGFHVIGSQAGMLSPSGRCFTFDERADGFVPADGIGMVVLKKLSAARADGDHVMGVIRGSAINQDGTSNGLTAPNALAQEQLEREVYDRFDIDVSQVQMAEAHGTGTVLGDPIEIQALTRAFRRRTDRSGYCAIGSVKSNMGHAAEAAGMAGMFKVLLSLQHRQIPPSLHYRTANPHIDFTDSPFYVNTSLRAWPAPDQGPRRAVLSAFGLSGTNAHLVIEEAPPVPPVAASGSPWLMAVSARTPDQLRASQQRLLDHLRERLDLDCAHISYTLLQGRRHFDHRWSCVAASATQLREALERALAEVPNGSAVRPSERDALDKKAAACIEAVVASPGDRASLERLAELFVRGGTPDFTALFGQGARRIPLPTYPFARERFWLKAPASSPAPPKPAARAATEPGTSETLQSFISQFLERALMLNAGELTPDSDLQELGADSLVSMRLMREIAHRYNVKVSGREVFQHSSVAALAEHISTKLDAGRVGDGATAGVEAKDRLDALLDAFEEGTLSVDVMERLIEEGAGR